MNISKELLEEKTRSIGDGVLLILFSLPFFYEVKRYLSYLTVTNIPSLWQCLKRTKRIVRTSSFLQINNISVMTLCIPVALSDFPSYRENARQYSEFIPAFMVVNDFNNDL